MPEYGTERFNVKIHYHIMIMNIISRTSESIRIGDPGELLGLHGALDVFYDILSSINNKVKLNPELKLIRDNLKKPAKDTYLINNKELRFDYYTKLGLYRSKLMEFYRYTGLVPPRASDLVSGFGEIEKISKEELLREDQLNIDKHIDKRGIKLSQTEIKEIDEYLKEDQEFVINDDDIDDGL